MANTTSAKDIRAGGAFIELYVKAPAKAMSRSFKIAEMQFRMFVRTTQRLAMALKATLASISRGFVSFGRSISRIVATSRAALSAIGSKMMLGGGISVGMLSYSIRTFALFEETMSAVKAVSQATGPQMTMLTEKAKELGRTTRFMASEVGRAMEAMSLAGFKPEEIESGISHVLNLALAGPLSIDQAADVAAKISIPFKIAAKDIDVVADALAMVNQKAPTTVEELAYGFRYVSGAAAATGQSLQDVAAAMAVLAKNSYTGSMAGTQLRQIIMQLSKASVGDIVESYGVRVKNAAGAMRPILDILTELDKKTARLMDPTQQAAFYGKLFGVRGALGAMALAKNPQMIAEQRANQANAAGAAKEMGRIKADNLMGDFIGLWSAIEGVQIALGEALLPTLRNVTQYLTKHVRSVIDWIGQNKELVVSITKVAAGIFAGGVALTGLVGVLSFAATLLAPIGAVFASVFTVMAGGTMIMASLASLVTTGVVGSVVTLGATLSGIIGLIGTAVPILVTCSSP